MIPRTSPAKSAAQLFVHANQTPLFISLDIKNGTADPALPRFGRRLRRRARWAGAWVSRRRRRCAGAAAQRVVEVVVDIGDGGGIPHRFGNRRDALGVNNSTFARVIG